MEAIVDDQDEVNLRRRELLHKKWNEQVFTPITKQIQTEIDGPNYGELSRCKRGLHRDYLEHVNRKVSLRIPERTRRRSILGLALGQRRIYLIISQFTHSS